MAATDSVESVDWPAALLNSQCRGTLGESLIHSQSDDRRRLNLDIEGLVSKKCTDYVAKTWRKLFRFITANVTRGLRRANTGR